MNKARSVQDFRLEKYATGSKKESTDSIHQASLIPAARGNCKETDRMKKDHKWNVHAPEKIHKRATDIPIADRALT